MPNLLEIQQLLAFLSFLRKSFIFDSDATCDPCCFAVVSKQPQRMEISYTDVVLVDNSVKR